MTTLEIHRLLDDAFAGVELTPEIQDLKEEMRASLVARVAELSAAGVGPADAAHQAIAGLGDVRAAIGEMPPAGVPRVRPRPSYVVRTVLLALAAVAVLAGLAWPVARATVGPVPWAVGVLLVALLGGVIVADALGQETTSNYPMPRRRAGAFGAASALGLGGLASIAVYLPTGVLRWPLAGALPVLASIVWFTYLGATQTNRHKPWVMRQADVGDRFTQDPVVAARFGVYTVAIGLLATGGFAALGLTIGWAWSWLALVAGGAAFMLTLARTLFAPDPR